MEINYKVYTYEMVYGNKPLLLIEFEIHTLRIAMKIRLDLIETQHHGML